MIGLTLGMTNGQFSFNFNGPTNQTMVIEGSTNLVDWIPLRTNAPSTGAFHFSDPESSSLPARYYRVRTE